MKNWNYFGSFIQELCFRPMVGRQNSKTVSKTWTMLEIESLQVQLEWHKLSVHRIAENFGGRKLWQIWRFATNSPKFYPPNACNIRKVARGWA